MLQNQEETKTKSMFMETLFILICCNCQLKSHFSFYLSVVNDRLLELEQ